MKILLADDDRVSRTLVSHHLRRAGYAPVEVSDGIEARDRLLADSGLRLAILDWVMPGLDGPDVCRAVRDHDQNGYRYLVLCTARDADDDFVEGLGAGADEFVRKPIDARRLIAKLRVGARIARAADELERARAHLYAVLSAIDEGVGLSDASGRIAFSNHALGALTGMAPLEGEDRVGWGRALIDRARARGLSPPQPGSGVELTTPEGRVLEWSVRSVGLADGTGRLDVLRDVTAVRALASALRAQAVEDALTGLTNRRGAEQSLEREIARARRHSGALSVLLLDVDHFKHVNDAYGHAVGDEVLRRVALTLRGAVRPYDVAARWGGEEFLVVLPGAARGDATSVAERIRVAIERAEGTPAVTASIGIAEWSGRDERPDDVIARADQALYRAKLEGRNRVVESAA